jgi:outer membrane protein insertion porin family
LTEGDGKLYYIRHINLHGVKYLNHSILKSSAGLVEGDSIYLPSKFISNAMQRLWSPRYFSNIQIGATIEGDSLDLEVFLKERARILSWKIEGVSKSKAKDLQDEVLKLRRNTELSDYVIDKNVKLIKEHFAEKGFRTCEVDARITNDTTYEHCVNVTFDIDRGPKVRVGVINFEGNDAFDDKRLRRTFKKTHQKSILFFQNRKLLPEEYENDKELLLDF